MRILNKMVKSKTRKELKALNIYESEPVTQNGSNGVITDNTHDKSPSVETEGRNTKVH